MSQNPKIRKPQLPATRREIVSFDPMESITLGPVLSGARLPIQITPAVDGFDLTAWCQQNKGFLDGMLNTNKALLFRSCGVETVDAFNRFVTALYGDGLVQYQDRSTPREELAQNVYTSTIYPAEHRIALHNEGTYWIKWPLKLIFCCIAEPTQGGETPIADSRRIYHRIPVAIREKFAQKQVLYVRNYNEGFGLTWQDAFQTRDPKAVEEYCRQNEIEFEWKSGARLRTRQIRPAIARLPKTGEETWFNHAAFFHISSLDTAIGNELMREFREEDLPYNTYYGDGTPIESDVLDVLRAAYQDEMIQFQWKKGDVMILDNMSVCHGRAPYSGPRKVVVAMAELFEAEANNS